MENNESTHGSAPTSVPSPSRIKVEPISEKDPESLRQSTQEKEEQSQEVDAVRTRTVEEGKGTVFAHPSPPWPSVPVSIPGDETLEGTEDNEDRSGKEPSVAEKKEDALMPPKLRLKRRWNDDPEAREFSKTGKFLWNGAGPQGLAAAATAAADA